MRDLLLASALLLSGCSGAPTEPTPDPVALVGLARVQAAPVEETVQLYGTADAGTAGSAILSAPEEAIVSAIEATVGSAVGRGQVVVRLTPSPTARLDLARAASDARAAQLAFARAQRLRADGLVGNAEVESARAAAESAGATQSSLAARTGSLTLRSPVAGYVEAIAAGPGSLVAGGTPIVTIAKAGDLRARFGIDPALARDAPGGAVVRVTPSGGGAAFAVPVLSVDPYVDPQTRLASVFVRVPEAAEIGAGEPLSGTLLVKGGGNAPSIPYSALLDEGGQPYVYVIVGGRAHRRDVTPGPVTGDRVAIVQGLRLGELVVVQGGTALEDGMRVRTR
jgi:RND family efflux transporter MFP subunit